MTHPRTKEVFNLMSLMNKCNPISEDDKFMAIFDLPFNSWRQEIKVKDLGEEMRIWKIQVKNYADIQKKYLRLQKEEGSEFGYERGIAKIQAEIDALVYNINRATALLDEIQARKNLKVCGFQRRRRSRTRRSRRKRRSRRRSRRRG